MAWAQEFDPFHQNSMLTGQRHTAYTQCSVLWFGGGTSTRLKIQWLIRTAHCNVAIKIIIWVSTSWEKYEVMPLKKLIQCGRKSCRCRHLLYIFLHVWFLFRMVMTSPHPLDSTWKRPPLSPPARLVILVSSNQHRLGLLVNVTFSRTSLVIFRSLRLSWFVLLSSESLKTTIVSFCVPEKCFSIWQCRAAVLAQMKSRSSSFTSCNSEFSSFYVENLLSQSLVGHITSVLTKHVID